MTAENDTDAEMTNGVWTERVLVGRQVGITEPPPWLVAAYEEFRENVIHPAFPCFFGTQAERRGEMFYTYASGSDFSRLPATMARFAELSASLENQKNNFAVFFEPKATAFTHDEFRYFCWDVLQYLHDHDPELTKYEQMLDPSDAEWEFTFSNLQMFVVGCSPTYERRRSRNLGPGVILLFQPRSVFIDAITKKEIGAQARSSVRHRLLKWDGVSAHSDLGVYGDPTNREWKQYFLPDGDAPEVGKCPFLTRHARALKASVQTSLAQTSLARPVAAVPEQDDDWATADVTTKRSKV